MPLCGGAASTRDATEEVQNVCNQIKGKAEQVLEKTFAEFRAISYRPQMVAGVNYFVKVATGDGAFLHVRIYRNLQGEVHLSGIQADKSEVEEIDYFEKHLD